MRILLLRIAGKKIPAQGGLKFVTEETSALTVDRNVPPCAGIFLPAIRNKRINSQRIAPPIPGQRRDVSAGLKFVTEETSALTVDRNVCVRFINSLFNIDLT
jgi:hypothetical protein